MILKDWEKTNSFQIEMSTQEYKDSICQLDGSKPIKIETTEMEPNGESDLSSCSIEDNKPIKIEATEMEPNEETDLNSCSIEDKPIKMEKALQILQDTVYLSDCDSDGNVAVPADWEDSEEESFEQFGSTDDRRDERRDPLGSYSHSQGPQLWSGGTTEKTSDAPSCLRCGMTFESKSLLKSHVEGEHKGRQFVCEECGKAFRQKSYLIVHQWMHNRGRPYECKLCGKAFSQSRKLKWHLKVHADTAPPQENVEGAATELKEEEEEEETVNVCAPEFVKCEVLDSDEMEDWGIQNHESCAAVNDEMHWSSSIQEGLDGTLLEISVGGGMDSSNKPDLELNSPHSENIQASTINSSSNNYLCRSSTMTNVLQQETLSATARFPPSMRRPRFRFTAEQTSVLEEEFCANQYLHPYQGVRISQAIGLTKCQVMKWFIQRRMKWRKENTKKAAPHGNQESSMVSDGSVVEGRGRDMDPSADLVTEPRPEQSVCLSLETSSNDSSSHVHKFSTATDNLQLQTVLTSATFPMRTGTLRMHFNTKQRKALEEEFQANQYPSLSRRISLSLSIGLSQHQITTWFINRRLMWRKKNTVSYSDKQSRALEREFQVEQYPSQSLRLRIAQTIGLTEIQVCKWFNIRRLKWKNEKSSEAIMNKNPETSEVSDATVMDIRDGEEDLAVNSDATVMDIRDGEEDLAVNSGEGLQQEQCHQPTNNFVVFSSNVTRPGVRCSNCRTSKALYWRRNDQNEFICNTCSLHYNVYSVNQPLAMSQDGIQLRLRRFGPKASQDQGLGQGVQDSGLSSSSSLSLTKGGVDPSAAHDTGLDSHQSTICQISKKEQTRISVS